MLDTHWLGTEGYVNLHRNQVSPALGRIFITYMACPGFGLYFGFHGVHPYQKNIGSHPPPPPNITVVNISIQYNFVMINIFLMNILSYCFSMEIIIHLATVKTSRTYPPTHQKHHYDASRGNMNMDASP